MPDACLKPPIGEPLGLSPDRPAALPLRCSSGFPHMHHPHRLCLIHPPASFETRHQSRTLHSPFSLLHSRNLAPFIHPIKAGLLSTTSSHLSCLRLPLIYSLAALYYRHLILEGNYTLTARENSSRWVFSVGRRRTPMRTLTPMARLHLPTL